MCPDSTNTLWCFHVFSCMVSKRGLNTKKRWWKSSLNLVQHIWKLYNCANSFHIIWGVLYIHESHTVCCVQKKFSLDLIKIWHICLDHSTFRMMRKLLSILLVTTQYEPLNFSKKFKNIYVTLYANLWTIKILYNAHLCIYNVVLSVCLTHKVP